MMILLACERDHSLSAPAEEGAYEAFIPEIVYPDDNTPTDVRIALGKKLFFDPILSEGNEISCASCHKPELAFADDRAVSPGIEGRLGERNSPSLVNVAYQNSLMREGGVPNLEMQALVPIADPFEMGSNILEAAERLQEISEYIDLSQQAYEREPDPFVITRSLAAYQRTLLSNESRYDQFKYEGDHRALTSLEVQGMNVFFSEKTQCSSCHSGFDFTNYEYANTGLYEEYEDEGRYRLTLEESDRSKFKVPSLRNVGLTAPYMHNGSMNTLSEVIDHYASGGKDHSNKSELITGFELDGTEKQALIAFLHSLTDENFINNEAHRPN